ncbi:MAG TPA: carbon-nitrogen hydrolase family protein [Nitrospiria bacterium]|nr:carbon-nitrogen hydrolase family protein [Nitrospiria bacterium]
MMRKRLCIAQIDVKADNPLRNLEKIKGVIAEHREADLIVFPELVVHGHIHSSAPRHEILQMIEQTPSRMKEELHSFAQECDTRVVFGEFDSVGDQLYNLAVYVSRNQVSRYAKTHVHWTESFDAGQEIRVFDTKLDRIGILICFDSAFPEAARVLALQGARIIIVIAAVPREFDIKYMDRRMSAIALDNQVFCVFANRAGRGFSGQSAVYNPQGDRIARAGRKEEILSVEIDLDEVDSWRNQEAIYPNRRPDLYGGISSSEDIPQKS